MGRPARICFPGAVHHIYQRGNNKEIIFSDDADRWRILKLFHEAKKKFGYLLYCYVLLSNHFHITIETTNNTPVSKIMHFVAGSYALYFNKKYGRVGHVFQCRFRDILVEKDEYLTSLSRYIHLNPVKAGLVKRPEDYFWSSYAAYLGERRDILVDTTMLLSYFGNVDDENTKIRYKKFVDLEIKKNDNDRDWLEDNLFRRRFLCSKGFIKNFQKTCQAPLGVVPGTFLVGA